MCELGYICMDLRQAKVRTNELNTFHIRALKRYFNSRNEINKCTYVKCVFIAYGLSPTRFNGCRDHYQRKL